jgi:glycosyltransferase involved in cell wall biosynthesis
MRLLLATHFFPPRHNAGTENYTCSLGRAFARRGHQVDVVCAGTWEHGKRYFNGATIDGLDGMRVARVNLDWTKASDPNRVLYDSSLLEQWFDAVLEERRPDVVHATSLMTLGVGILRAAHRRKIPLVLTLMDFWFMCARTVLTRKGQLCDGRTTNWECQECMLDCGSRLFRQVDPWVPGLMARTVWQGLTKAPWSARQRGLRGVALNMGERRQLLTDALSWPDLVVSHSRFVKDMFSSVGLDRGILHVPNGHDLGWVSRYRGKTPSSTIRFGYLGQIVSNKGIDLLIDAFRRTYRSNTATLDIWGNANAAPEYTAHIKSLADGCAAIRWRGPYAHHRLADVLSDIDVIVVPSEWYENAPLVIQEAFATRTPVIATRLGGMAEAVTDGVNGLLFAHKDADALASCLKRVADEPALLQRLAAGAPSVRTIDDEVGQLESLYESIGSPTADGAGVRLDA